MCTPVEEAGCAAEVNRASSRCSGCSAVHITEPGGVLIPV